MISANKVTTEQFIAKVKLVHGDKYDYSKVRYVGAHKKVIIVCHEHGEFFQTPNNHSRKDGCPKCSKHIPLNNNIFITKARLIHGDKYDYSKVNYITCTSKVIIICHEHGEFKQRPICHYKGYCCPKCSQNTINKKLRLTTEQFIAKARLIHGDKYDYSKVDYISEHKKVIIICPRHGEFSQQPNCHLNNDGCPGCNESKGERIIRKYLKNDNVKFKSEKSFINLRGLGGGLLRFDFFLSDHNICIEFDGRQHFDKKYCETTFKSDYNKLKIHDRKKSRYCRKHKIKLIRIPYWDIKNINQILSSEIPKQETTT